MANNRVIFNNTIFLYVRMAFVLAVNLYLSRVILEALGVVDYGIYNIVGSVVVLFSYVNSALSVATVRFFSYEMHRGNERLSLVFNTSIKIQIIFSILLLLLMETFGLWLVNEKLVIPLERLSATNWVYQFSILTSFITIIRVPYESSIIAHEQMHMFAIFSIVEVLLKLVFVSLMTVVSYDQLIVYGLLLLLISIIGFILRYVYCKRNYEEVKILKNSFDKTLFKKMFSFVGWNLFGATAGMSVSQGLSFVMNQFFGPTVNAARGIAVQVEGAASQFATNINTAINPQIVKRYSVGDNDGAFNLAFFSTKIVFILLFIISIPIIFNVDYVLNLWLKNPPDYAGEFTQLELIYLLTLSLTYSVNMCAQASGKIKIFQMVEGGVLLLNIPISLVLYKLGLPPFIAFVSLIVVSMIALFAKLLVVGRQMSFPVKAYIKSVVLPIVLVTSIFGIVYYYYSCYSAELSSFIQFVAHTLVIWLVLIPTVWIVVLSTNEKKMLIEYIHKYIAKFKR